MKLMPVAVAVSGGIDSLCALLMLKESGRTVVALHGIFQDIPAHLPPLLDSLHIPLETLDLRKDFKTRIIGTTEASLLAGKTPNPCALCNRHIKFGLLLDYAKSRGFVLATGHYAATTRINGVPLLTRPLDTAKDQSYFLSLISPQALESLLFPQAHLSKDTCRRYLRERGIVIQTKESQDICFTPEVKDNPGPIRLVDDHGVHEVTARHRGLHHYTMGQRKGIGVAFTEPLYVIRKDVAENILYLGTRAHLGMYGLLARHINIFMPRSLWPEKLLVRVRYRQKPCPALVDITDDCMRIRFPSPEFPTDRDQLVSVTDEQGRILAGGLVDAIDLI